MLKFTSDFTASAGNKTLILNGSGLGEIAGAIVNNTGNLTRLTKSGTGTWTLSGNNTYSGTTTVSAGVLNIEHANALGATSGNTTVSSGAALQLQGSITVGAEALSLNGTGVSTTGALRNISGSNTYGGAITLAGATRINSDADLLTLSGGIVGNTQNLTIGGSGNTTINSAIATTTGSLTKDGTGTLILSGANSYTGNTTVSLGTLALGANDVISNSSNLIINGGTFDISSYSDTVGVITMTNGSLIGTTGVLTGSAYNITGGIVTAQLGGGTLIIGNGTTDIGAVGSNVGLSVNGSSAVANLTANVVAQSVTLNNGGSITGSFSLNQTGGVTANSGLIASNLIGTGGVTMNGTGNTLTLAGINTYTGATTISAGNLSISSAAALGSTSGVNLADTTALIYTGAAGNLTRDISVTGTTGSTGTIRNSGTGLLTLSGALSKNGTTLTLAGGNNGITVSGVISGSNPNSDLVIDGGSVTLAAANTYNGPTSIINSGTLNANTAGALPTSTLTAVTINGNSTLALGASQSVASLSGTTGSTVNLNANTLTINGSSSTTYSGGISGTGNLVKTGSGTQTLAGATTFNGTTTVNSGTLQAATANALANTSQVVLNNGGSFLVTADDAIGTNTGIELNGGTLAFGAAGYDGYVGALTLSANSTIDLGTSSNGVLIRFNSINWNNSNALLSIYNWTGNTYYQGGYDNNLDKVIFTNPNFTTSELQRISFYSGIDQSSFVGDATLITSGLFPNQIIAVPETETYITAVILLLGFGIYQIRLARQGQGLLSRLTFLRQRKC